MRIYHYPSRNLLQIDKSKILVLTSLNISVKSKFSISPLQKGEHPWSLEKKKSNL